MSSKGALSIAGMAISNEIDMEGLNRRTEWFAGRVQSLSVQCVAHWIICSCAAVYPIAVPRHTEGVLGLPTLLSRGRAGRPLVARDP